MAQSKEEMDVLRLFYKEKDLVISPTRYPKPLSQVAENITVITAKDIEAMNAHTVTEVLNRVPGIFLANFNRDFGSASLIRIQGSNDMHVLILVDDVPWNFLASGAAETNSVHIGIIDHIEVIKGPASSAWGSSLGGVINIITKPAGNNTRPAMSVIASYGEKKTQDYRAEVSGRAGLARYYIFGGHQESDGLRSSRSFDNNSLYSKFNIPISRDMDIGLSIGYSKPSLNFGDLPTQDITSVGNSRTFFATTSLDVSLSRELSASVSFYTFKQKFALETDVLGLERDGSSRELFSDIIYDEKTTGGSGKLVLTHGIHTAVLGVDLSCGKLDQTITAGPYLQSLPPPYNLPLTTKTHPDIDKWAIFVNDTITIDRWTITPGMRYDHNDITGSFISPSIGLTYRLSEDSILRVSVAKGFTIPPLSHTSGGGLFFDPNPSLESEEVWSYQGGVESNAAKFFWVKATLFRHELKNAIELEPSGLSSKSINKGKIRRQGVELEAETRPLYNLSLLAGFAYVHKKSFNESGTTEPYSCNIGVKYDDRESFSAQLFGHYIWWDLDGSSIASYNNFIWDMNLNKKIYSREKTTAEIFLTAHNIFNSSQYTFSDNKNPRRWLEAGIKFKF